MSMRRPSRVRSSPHRARCCLQESDILAGQQVFLKYGLMENGSIWGHGAYLGPDFSAEYLHTLAVDTGNHLAQSIYGRPSSELSPVEAAAVTCGDRRAC